MGHLDASGFPTDLFPSLHHNSAWGQETRWDDHLEHHLEAGSATGENVATRRRIERLVELRSAAPESPWPDLVRQAWHDEPLAEDTGDKRPRDRARVSAPPPRSQTDVTGQLERLFTLLERGAITRTEFDRQKASLLGVEPAPVPAVPSQVGAYSITGVIGQGGMGAVYRGRHRNEVIAERQGGDVAIKVMHPQFARNPEFQARFEREASLGLRLDHPGIVKVHDLVVDAGVLALVMERVGGRSLDHVIGREVGPIPWPRARPMFEQLLDAVEHAHSQGVIHRDLKPDNVMVTGEGQLKILDFGIAKQAGATGATATGVGMGTVDYMAPEQHTDARNVDQRADVYALGMTLYAMLAGRLPWGDELDALGVLQLKLSGGFPPPTEFYPDIPTEVVEAVMAALVSVDARPGSVAALREALGGRSDGRPASGSTPPAPPPPVQVRPRRSAGFWAGIAGGLLFLAGLIAVGLFFGLEALEEARERADDEVACEEARGADDLDAWNAYLEARPEGGCSQEARTRLREIPGELAEAARRAEDLARGYSVAENDQVLVFSRSSTGDDVVVIRPSGTAVIDVRGLCGRSSLLRGQTRTSSNGTRVKIRKADLELIWRGPREAEVETFDQECGRRSLVGTRLTLRQGQPVEKWRPSRSVPLQFVEASGGDLGCHTTFRDRHGMITGFTGDFGWCEDDDLVGKWFRLNFYGNDLLSSPGRCRRVAAPSR